MRKIRRRIKIRWDRIKIGSKEAKISTEKGKGEKIMSDGSARDGER